MRGSRRTAGFTLMELMIVVAIIGLLSAIAVPSMYRMQARSRQSEAKIALRGFFTAAKAHYAETQRFDCGRCGWEIDPDHRYNYFLSATEGATGSDGCAAAEAGLIEAAQTNISPSSPGGFTAGAAGNIDGDSYCDGWNINDTADLWCPQDDVTGG